MFLFLAKYRQMAKKKFNHNFGDFFSKTHFLIAKIFIQFDHFSSDLTIFHPLSKFSSNYDDFIQYMDENAALFISLVPQVR
jgi:hypothetical protein